MTSQGKLLVVEDDLKVATLLARSLLAAGYEVEVIHDGKGVVEAVKANAPDLILLDIMLPEMSGLDISREIRGFSEVPIIMLTAMVEEIDRLAGWDAGADDYVCKPFSPREVVARVKAILRRSQSGSSTREVPGLKIDNTSFMAELDGHPMPLTPVEFRLLRTLVEAAGRIVSRNKLMESLYADHRVVHDRVVDSHIKNLRHKLHEANPDRDLIRTIYGLGYKIELP